METTTDRKWLWAEYFDAFPYFSDQNVRKGCHPRKFIHEKGSTKAIVLVHGLSDSSYFMVDIAEYFYNVLGYDVYVPLLQGHGLKSPDGMNGVSLSEWKENVGFAVRVAHGKSTHVSIGGLSMGGALAFYFGCTDQKVTGNVYLFAAAFGLAPGLLGVTGTLKEYFLRLPFATILESKSSLISDNPYRYNRVTVNSAMELVHLMAENSKLSQEVDSNREGANRLFAAWSECDEVVNIQSIKRLEEMLPQHNFTSFVLPEEKAVSHACLVLEKSVYAIGAKPGESPLEPANPLFDDMMAAIAKFDSVGSSFLS